MDFFSYGPLLQIFVALLLGTVIGLERTIMGKMAGMRTYAIVSMASCVFVVTSTIMSVSWGTNLSESLRVVAAIITGIGFLGAGLIIFRESESKLSGLTTAAGLWISCGIGIAVGYGLYAIAIFVTALTIIDFTVLKVIENKIKSISGRNLSKGVSKDMLGQ